MGFDIEFSADGLAAPRRVTQANPFPVGARAGLPDATATGSLTDTINAVQLPMAGYAGAAFVLSGAWSGVVIAEVSCDGGLTWTHSTLWQFGGTSVPGQALTSASSNGQYGVLDLGGVSHIRVRAYSYASGTVAVALRTTQAAAVATSPFEAAVGATGLFGSHRLAISGGFDQANAAQEFRFSNTSPGASVPGVVARPVGASKTKFRDLAATVQSVKASAGTLKSLTVVNNQGATAWIQLFDLATGSVTLGTTNPDLEFSVPANTTQVYTVGTDGAIFTTAISVASTTTEKGSTGSAAGVHLFAFYW